MTTRSSHGIAALLLLHPPWCIALFEALGIFDWRILLEKKTEKFHGTKATT